MSAFIQKVLPEAMTNYRLHLALIKSYMLDTRSASKYPIDSELRTIKDMNYVLDDGLFRLTKDTRNYSNPEDTSNQYWYEPSKDTTGMPSRSVAYAYIISLTSDYVKQYVLIGAEGHVDISTRLGHKTDEGTTWSKWRPYSDRNPSYELLQNTSGKSNTNYISFGDHELALPDARECDLGTVIRLDQWKGKGRVYSVEGETDENGKVTGYHEKDTVDTEPVVIEYGSDLTFQIDDTTITLTRTGIFDWSNDEYTLDTVLIDDKFYWSIYHGETELYRSEQYFDDALTPTEANYKVVRDGLVTEDDANINLSISEPADTDDAIDTCNTYEFEVFNDHEPYNSHYNYWVLFTYNDSKDSTAKIAKLYKQSLDDLKQDIEDVHDRVTSEVLILDSRITQVSGDLSAYVDSSIYDHDHDPSAHQYILNMIAMISIGGGGQAQSLAQHLVDPQAHENRFAPFSSRIDSVVSHLDYVSTQIGVVSTQLINYTDYTSADISEYVAKLSGDVYTEINNISNQYITISNSINELSNGIYTSMASCCENMTNLIYAVSQDLSSYVDITSQNITEYVLQLSNAVSSLQIGEDVTSLIYVVSRDLSTYVDTTSATIIEYVNLVSQNISERIDETSSGLSSYTDQVSDYVNTVSTQLSTYVDVTSQSITDYVTQLSWNIANIDVGVTDVIVASGLESSASEDGHTIYISGVPATASDYGMVVLTSTVVLLDNLHISDQYTVPNTNAVYNAIQQLSGSVVQVSSGLSTFVNDTSWSIADYIYKFSSSIYEYINIVDSGLIAVSGHSGIYVDVTSDNRSAHISGLPASETEYGMVYAITSIGPVGSDVISKNHMVPTVEAVLNMSSSISNQITVVSQNLSEFVVGTSGSISSTIYEISSGISEYIDSTNASTVSYVDITSSKITDYIDSLSWNIVTSMMSCCEDVTSLIYAVSHDLSTYVDVTSYELTEAISQAIYAMPIATETTYGAVTLNMVSNIAITVVQSGTDLTPIYNEFNYYTRWDAIQDYLATEDDDNTLGAQFLVTDDKKLYTYNEPADGTGLTLSGGGVSDTFGVVVTWDRVEYIDQELNTTIRITEDSDKEIPIVGNPGNQFVVPTVNAVYSALMNLSAQIPTITSQYIYVVSEVYTENHNYDYHTEVTNISQFYITQVSEYHIDQKVELNTYSGISNYKLNDSTYVISGLPATITEYGMVFAYTEIAEITGPAAPHTVPTVNAVSEYGTQILSVVSLVSGNLSTYVDTTSSKIIDYINSLSFVINEDMTSCCENMTSLIYLVSHDLSNYTTQVSGGLETFISTVSGNLSTYVTTVSGGISAKITEVSGNLKTYVDETSSTIIEYINNLPQVDPGVVSVYVSSGLYGSTTADGHSVYVSGLPATTTSYGMTLITDTVISLAATDTASEYTVPNTNAVYEAIGKTSASISQGITYVSSGIVSFISTVSGELSTFVREISSEIIDYIDNLPQVDPGVVSVYVSSGLYGSTTNDGHSVYISGLPATMNSYGMVFTKDEVEWVTGPVGDYTVPTVNAVSRTIYEVSSGLYTYINNVSDNISTNITLISGNISTYITTISGDLSTTIYDVSKSIADTINELDVGITEVKASSGLTVDDSKGPVVTVSGLPTDTTNYGMVKSIETITWISDPSSTYVVPTVNAVSDAIFKASNGLYTYITTVSKNISSYIDIVSTNISAHITEVSGSISTTIYTISKNISDAIDNLDFGVSEVKAISGLIVDDSNGPIVTVSGLPATMTSYGMVYIDNKIETITGNTSDQVAPTVNAVSAFVFDVSKGLYDYISNVSHSLYTEIYTVSKDISDYIEGLDFGITEVKAASGLTVDTSTGPVVTLSGLPATVTSYGMVIAYTEVTNITGPTVDFTVPTNNAVVSYVSEQYSAISTVFGTYTSRIFGQVPVYTSRSGNDYLVKLAIDSTYHSGVMVSTTTLVDGSTYIAAYAQTPDAAAKLGTVKTSDTLTKVVDSTSNFTVPTVNAVINAIDAATLNVSGLEPIYTVTNGVNVGVGLHYSDEIKNGVHLTGDIDGNTITLRAEAQTANGGTQIGTVKTIENVTYITDTSSAFVVPTVNAVSIGLATLSANIIEYVSNVVSIVSTTFGTYTSRIYGVAPIYTSRLGNDYQIELKHDDNYYGGVRTSVVVYDDISYLMANAQQPDAQDLIGTVKTVNHMVWITGDSKNFVVPTVNAVSLAITSALYSYPLATSNTYGAVTINQVTNIVDNRVAPYIDINLTSFTSMLGEYIPWSAIVTQENRPDVWAYTLGADMYIYGSNELLFNYNNPTDGAGWALDAGYTRDNFGVVIAWNQISRIEVELNEPHPIVPGADKTIDLIGNPGDKFVVPTVNAVYDALMALSAKIPTITSQYIYVVSEVYTENHNYDYHTDVYNTSNYYVTQVSEIHNHITQSSTINVTYNITSNFYNLVSAHQGISSMVNGSIVDLYGIPATVSDIGVVYTYNDIEWITGPVGQHTVPTVNAVSKFGYDISHGLYTYIKEVSNEIIEYIDGLPQVDPGVVSVHVHSGLTGTTTNNGHYVDISGVPATAELYGMVLVDNAITTVLTPDAGYTVPTVNAVSAFVFNVSNGLYQHINLVSQNIATWIDVVSGNLHDEIYLVSYNIANYVTNLNFGITSMSATSGLTVDTTTGPTVVVSGLPAATTSYGMVIAYTEVANITGPTAEFTVPTNNAVVDYVTSKTNYISSIFGTYTSTVSGVAPVYVSRSGNNYQVKLAIDSTNYGGVLVSTLETGDSTYLMASAQQPDAATKIGTVKTQNNLTKVTGISSNYTVPTVNAVSAAIASIVPSVSGIEPIYTVINGTNVSVNLRYSDEVKNGVHLTGSVDGTQVTLKAEAETANGGTQIGTVKTIETITYINDTSSAFVVPTINAVSSFVFGVSRGLYSYISNVSHDLYDEIYLVSADINNRIENLNFGITEVKAISGLIVDDSDGPVVTVSGLPATMTSYGMVIAYTEVANITGPAAEFTVPTNNAVVDYVTSQIGYVSTIFGTYTSRVYGTAPVYTSRSGNDYLVNLAIDSSFYSGIMVSTVTLEDGSTYLMAAGGQPDALTSFGTVKTSDTLVRVLDTTSNYTVPTVNAVIDGIGIVSTLFGTYTSRISGVAPIYASRSGNDYKITLAIDSAYHNGVRVSTITQNGSTYLTADTNIEIPDPETYGFIKYAEVNTNAHNGIRLVVGTSSLSAYGSVITATTTNAGLNGDFGMTKTINYVPTAPLNVTASYLGPNGITSTLVAAADKCIVPTINAVVNGIGAISTIFGSYIKEVSGTAPVYVTSKDNSRGVQLAYDITVRNGVKLDTSNINGSTYLIASAGVPDANTSIGTVKTSSALNRVIDGTSNYTVPTVNAVIDEIGTVSTTFGNYVSTVSGIAPIYTSKKDNSVGVWIAHNDEYHGGARVSTIVSAGSTYLMAEAQQPNAAALVGTVKTQNNLVWVNDNSYVYTVPTVNAVSLAIVEAIYSPSNIYNINYISNITYEIGSRYIPWEAIVTQENRPDVWAFTLGADFYIYGSNELLFNYNNPADGGGWQLTGGYTKDNFGTVITWDKISRIDTIINEPHPVVPGADKTIDLVGNPGDKFVVPTVNAVYDALQELSAKIPTITSQYIYIVSEVYTENHLYDYHTDVYNTSNYYVTHVSEIHNHITQSSTINNTYNITSNFYNLVSVHSGLSSQVNGSVVDIYGLPATMADIGMVFVKDEIAWVTGPVGDYTVPTVNAVSRFGYEIDSNLSRRINIVSGELYNEIYYVSGNIANYINGLDFGITEVKAVSGLVVDTSVGPVVTITGQPATVNTYGMVVAYTEVANITGPAAEHTVPTNNAVVDYVTSQIDYVSTIFGTYTSRVSGQTPIYTSRSGNDYLVTLAIDPTLHGGVMVSTTTLTNGSTYLVASAQQPNADALIGTVKTQNNLTQVNGTSANYTVPTVNAVSYAIANIEIPNPEDYGYIKYTEVNTNAHNGIRLVVGTSSLSAYGSVIQTTTTNAGANGDFGVVKTINYVPTAPLSVTATYIGTNGIDSTVAAAADKCIVPTVNAVVSGIGAVSNIFNKYASDVSGVAPVYTSAKDNSRGVWLAYNTDYHGGVRLSTITSNTSTYLVVDARQPDAGTNIGTVKTQNNLVQVTGTSDAYTVPTVNAVSAAIYSAIYAPSNIWNVNITSNVIYEIGSNYVPWVAVIDEAKENPLAFKGGAHFYIYGDNDELHTYNEIADGVGWVNAQYDNFGTVITWDKVSHIDLNVNTFGPVVPGDANAPTVGIQGNPGDKFVVPTVNAVYNAIMELSTKIPTITSQYIYIVSEVYAENHYYDYHTETYPTTNSYITQVSEIHVTQTMSLNAYSGLKVSKVNSSTFDLSGLPASVTSYGMVFTDNDVEKITNSALAECTVPTVNAVADIISYVSQYAYIYTANNHTYYHAGFVEVRTGLDKVSSYVVVNGTSYYNEEHVVPSINVLCAVSKDLNDYTDAVSTALLAHVNDTTAHAGKTYSANAPIVLNATANPPSFGLSYSDDIERGVRLGVVNNLLKVSGVPAQFITMNNTTIWSMGVVKTYDGVSYINHSVRTDNTYYDYQYTVPTLNALALVSSYLSAHVTDATAHAGTTYEFDTDAHLGVKLAQAGSTVSAVGVPAFFTDNTQTTTGYELGVVRVMNTISYVPTTTSVYANRPLYKYTVPTMNALIAVSQIISAHIADNTQHSDTTYTFDTGTYSGVKLVTDGTTVSAVGEAASYGANNTSSLGVVYTRDSINTSITANTSEKYTVPTVNAVWELSKSFYNHQANTAIHGGGGTNYNGIDPIFVYDGDISISAATTTKSGAVKVTNTISSSPYEFIVPTANAVWTALQGAGVGSGSMLFPNYGSAGGLTDASPSGSVASGTAGASGCWLLISIVAASGAQGCVGVGINGTFIPLAGLSNAAITQLLPIPPGATWQVYNGGGSGITVQVRVL